MTDLNSSFYIIGLLFVAIGVALILVPLLAGAGSLTNAKLPWIVLYVYNKGGFYFATSPILIIATLIALGFILLRK